MPPAEHIRSVRESLGLSRPAFASAYEIPGPTLAAWESGEAVPPVYVLRMLDVIVKALPPDKLEDPE